MSAAPAQRSQTAVVIVNHDTVEPLRRSLTSSAAESPAHIVVVDSGSSDGSADMVRRDFPGVELVCIDNRGYGAAANAGLARVCVPFALLLNADARPLTGAVAVLERYLDEHPAVAVVGPRILNEQGQPAATAHRLPLPLDILLQETGLHRLGESRRLRQERPRPADWVLGAALALRLSAINEIGGFDETYFMYNEEIDLCLRLRHGGRQVHYVPSATVIHTGGASTSRRRAEMAARYVSSTVLFYRRHFSPLRLVELRLLLGLVLAARLARDTLRSVVVDADERAALHDARTAWRAGLRALLGHRE